MKAFTTIKSKILMLVISLVVIIGVAMTVYFDRSAKSAFSENVRDMLKNAGMSYQNAIDDLISKGLNYGEFFAADNAIKEAVRLQILTDYNKTLIAILEAYYSKLDLKNIEYINREGAVLARGRLPDQFGDSKMDFSFTRMMIEKQRKSWDYEVGKTGVALKFGVPILVDDQFTGFLGYGYYIDGPFLHMIKRATNAELAFILGKRNELIATTDEAVTLERIDRDRVNRSLKGEESLELRRSIGDRIFSALYLPVTDASGQPFGALCALKDITDKTAAHQRRLTLSVIAIAVTMALALITSVALVQTITRPIYASVDGLRDNARQVASVGETVDADSRSLAEGTSENASSIEETTSSIEELSAMNRRNADNAGHADQLMKQVNAEVTGADAAMKELIASMHDISKSSEDTFQIIKTIDEIAFQTNLLALNAAVEAARAGEVGAGFAVVADEVRNLAMRAAEAARHTSDLIAETVKKIQRGSDVAAKAGEAFRSVSATSLKASDLVAEISSASEEQAKGLEQINAAMSDIEKVIQKNAAVAEESAAASQELNLQAGRLTAFVDTLIDLAGTGGSREERAHLIPPAQPPSGGARTDDV